MILRILLVVWVVGAGLKPAPTCGSPLSFGHFPRRAGETQPPCPFTLTLALSHQGRGDGASS